MSIQTTPQTRRFQRMLDLSQSMKDSRALAQLGIDRDTQWRGLQDYNRAKEQLGAIVGTMDLEEMREYMDWCITQKQAQSV